MHRPSRRKASFALAAALIGPSWPALAQVPAWPNKPVKLVVPFPPGGGTDLAARIVGERLAARLGQPVVIDNKPGGATAIGVSLVSGAEPDGYTLLFSGSTSYTVNPAVRPRLGDDPLKQLTPIAMVARAPLVLVTAGDGPHKTLTELLAQAQAKPGSLSYTTFGAGTAPHLAGELLATTAGVKLMPVPYKGSAEATIGVARADVTLGIDTLAAAMPHIQSGKLRALAIISPKRSALLPGVPSYGDLQLVPAVFEGWYAMAAPANLSAPVRERLVTALAGVMAEPEVRSKLAQQSMEPVLLGPQALRDVMDEEITRYRAAVARAGLRLD
jgi:tripartite-type tricarboxylate transporter receptor subunit TctC